ncbi:MAG: molybdate ABC transporter substrate-binding protein [Aquisalinus sp.]|nr:molybdate ABC transporter substrate-binding protein [Aquisalinus sp.]
MKSWITNITICFAVFITLPSVAVAGEARLAVASSFAQPARALGEVFEAQTGHTVRFSFGSTGLLYTQIVHGAPFDLFLAADQARPIRAIEEGHAVAGSRFTYAQGSLVLFSAEPDRRLGAETLRSQTYDRLAIANARTAPYGAAAVEVLQALGIYDDVVGKIVQGANIAQAYQFVQTGNAELGFVARAQLPPGGTGSYWIVPTALYTPLRHDAVLLGQGDNEAAQAFLAFLQSETGRAIIAKHGFDLLPETSKSGT